MGYNVSKVHNIPSLHALVTTSAIAQMEKTQTVLEGIATVMTYSGICLFGELLSCDQGLFCVVSHYMVGHDYTGFVSFETPENGMFWIELCVSMVRISTPQVLLTLLMTF